MDVLFINPSSGKQVYQALANKYSAISTPYWLLLLAESTRSSGYEVSVLDLLAEGIQKDRAVERINKLNPNWDTLKFRDIQLEKR